MGKSSISMTIFHCYVSSPEGSCSLRSFLSSPGALDGSSLKLTGEKETGNSPAWYRAGWTNIDVEHQQFVDDFPDFPMETRGFHSFSTSIQWEISRIQFMEVR